MDGRQFKNTYAFRNVHQNNLYDIGQSYNYSVDLSKVLNYRILKNIASKHSCKT